MNFVEVDHVGLAQDVEPLRRDGAGDADAEAGAEERMARNSTAPRPPPAILLASTLKNVDEQMPDRLAPPPTSLSTAAKDEGPISGAMRDASAEWLYWEGAKERLENGCEGAPTH